MELNIQYLPPTVTEWDLTRSLAKILHDEDFHPRNNPEERLINFKVEINPSKAGGMRNDGTGVLVLSHQKIGHQFLDWVRQRPLKIEGRKIKFYLDKQRKLRHWLSLTLQRTPYVDPDIEEAHQQKLHDLDAAFRVDTVEFGVFFSGISAAGKRKSREFSIEWKQDYTKESAAWLRFEYDHKLIRITLGNSMTERTGYSIAIPFASIMKVGYGYDPAAYVCFDTLTPPVFEKEDFHRTLVGDQHVDNKKFKHRVGSLNPGHERVAPYCQKLRITLYNDPRKDVGVVFRKMCKTAELADSLIAHCAPPFNVEAANHSLFADKRLYLLRESFKGFNWSVVFQLECLLHNCRLHPGEIDLLLPRIRELHNDNVQDSRYLAGLLRAYNTTFSDPINNKDNYIQSFEKIQKDFTLSEFDLPRGNFNCCHVTFTPTRLILEGPYPTQSNRIIRRYEGYEDYFIRVDFRDEDRLQYRWDRQVDGRSFLRERVGGILKKGFELGGRYFYFLAYSNSALREHAVWFMSAFEHPDDGWVTPDTIRDSIGDFKNLVEEDYSEEDKRFGFFEKDKKLLQQPSKYAARIAQAFTATDPSVKITREEWEIVEDIGGFTDGVGTISESLAEEIWGALCKARGHDPARFGRPSAYQIRFLGFKGMVVVDKQLDQVEGKIRMRLRPSMRKFGNRTDVGPADIEIARSFERPNSSYLNRPLVTILEGRGVKKDAFVDLLNNAVADIHSVDDSLEQYHTFLRDHSLGNTFNLSWILQQLEKMDSCIGEPPSNRHVNIDNPFLQQLRSVARMDVLREIKHRARIPVPKSRLLVGVADEGPAYMKAGYEKVYCLPEGHIYACVQNPDDEKPTYLEGTCTISRSPVAHPGDVQRVHAIGKPPPGLLCFFEGLKNVVVLPSVGKRPLASCLGGGDLDGDLYDIITYSELLPTQNEKPASYDEVRTLTLDRESNMEDVCDFVVEYIYSDVLGLLSDRLLIIADQSKDGIYDKDCLHLARLCALAVDYAKQGIPVDPDKEGFPSTLIRCKPDWHAAEVVDPRGTDYYLSTRALGEMFRKHAPPDNDNSNANSKSQTKAEMALLDPISRVLRDKIEGYLFPHVDPGSSKDPEMKNLFSKYRDELRYICATHTLSNTPGVALLEAEVVMGTTLAKCSQNRWRKDRMWRMKTHASTLVKEVNKILSTCPDRELDTRDQALYTLERAWYAWDLSLKRVALGEARERFGGHSFGLIALDSILKALETLGKLDQQQQSQQGVTPNGNMYGLSQKERKKAISNGNANGLKQKEQRKAIPNGNANDFKQREQRKATPNGISNGLKQKKQKK
ncbi:RdRP-domain-containing protein [Marasmius fiardii PR-910]|nr:RdRP-domain-containing protein [Marasmius fiardii PR-910]